jgi:hypothetical protein
MTIKSNQFVNYKKKSMKKALLHFPNGTGPQALTPKAMKQIVGGYGAYPYCDTATFICGCIDVENNFYHGPCGAGYCDRNYGGEPWCVRR